MVKVRYSFGSRHTGAARNPKNIRKQRKKFPKLVRDVLSISDIILEVVDARFIEDMRDLELEKEIERQKLKFILKSGIPITRELIYQS